MEEIDLQMVQFGKGFDTLPSLLSLLKELEKLAINSKLAYDGNLMLAWMAGLFDGVARR